MVVGFWYPPMLSMRGVLHQEFFVGISILQLSSHISGTSPLAIPPSLPKTRELLKTQHPNPPPPCTQAHLMNHHPHPPPPLPPLPPPFPPAPNHSKKEDGTGVSNYCRVAASNCCCVPPCEEKADASCSEDP